ncbi:YbfB/YjiJ family MFS transporter [Marinobacterium sediminicola]|uniref:Predicted arabinose efflux permease, MFS family n=1 Tax=Marinobacterium sediminicola TaxID=518898 RepID=A0ABY1RW14_9GAMM|nr:YbfB/YjiJ family MFS transporter [Marinobacterium sediminicola]ULG70467.1 YbfB/YjiJ family MFS transporter [Marinobacterium sediminicola]SMR69264.1 Predicted arabinose efflux permease, MFS family [Marinobacterium sediminicola]
MSDQAQRLKVLFAGIFSQILCIGIARFSYTPLLPVMQDQTWIGDAEGGWLAAINYAGYMCGALMAAMLSDLQLKDRIYRICLLMAVVTTAGMAMTENMAVWSLLRFLSGFSSAGSMLIASGLILNWLIRHHHRGELGIHFAGVGLGIMFAAIVVEAMLRLTLNWADQWLWFAALGCVLAIPAWRWLPPPAKVAVTHGGQPMLDQPPGARFLWLMMTAYFCAGYGYVISATFIVTIVEREPELSGMGQLVFLVVGLAAAPAVMVWDLVARRLGYLGALFVAYLVQVVGIVMPTLSDSLTAVLISAVLYGGTFIGCVSLVLTMAGRLYPTKPAKLMGKMTLSYGVAQIVAPALTGVLAEQSGNYNLGLWLAGGFVLLGAALIVILKLTDRTATELDQSNRLVTGRQ